MGWLGLSGPGWGLAEAAATTPEISRRYAKRRPTDSPQNQDPARATAFGARSIPAQATNATLTSTNQSPCRV